MATLQPRRSAPTPQPSQENLIEGLGALDVGEMPRVGDLLVACARDQLGDAPILCRGRARILAAADDQGRYLERGQLGCPIEVQDRGGATEKARGRGRGDGVADLLPAMR